MDLSGLPLSNCTGQRMVFKLRIYSALDIWTILNYMNQCSCQTKWKVWNKFLTTFSILLVPLKQVIEIKSSFEQVLSMFSFHVLHPPSYEIQSLVATHSMRCKRQGTRTLFQVSHEKRWLAHWKSLPGGYFIATTLYMYTTKDITITKILPFFLAITISAENCQPLRVLIEKLNETYLEVEVWL